MGTLGTETGRPCGGRGSDQQAREGQGVGTSRSWTDSPGASGGTSLTDTLLWTSSLRESIVLSLHNTRGWRLVVVARAVVQMAHHTVFPNMCNKMPRRSGRLDARNLPALQRL